MTTGYKISIWKNKEDVLGEVEMVTSKSFSFALGGLVIVELNGR